MRTKKWKNYIVFYVRSWKLIIFFYNSTIVTEYQKPQTKDLPCIFANLVDLYTDKGLKPCATKRNQTWRHASSKAAAERLLIYHDYIPELNSLHPLDSYSICEIHYNQVIVTN